MAQGIAIPQYKTSQYNNIAHSTLYRAIMAAQFLGTVAILAFVPGNIEKALACIILWALTFRKLTRGEIIFYIGASIFFAYIDYASLKQGLFKFDSPDILMVPYYEPLLWGYLFLNVRHTLNGPVPKNSWLVGLAYFILYLIPYLFITDQALLFYVSLTVIIGALAFFHDRYDFIYVGYMILLGTIWEYSGVWSGQWSYPNPPLGGVPPWYISAFGGVALALRRMITPLLGKQSLEQK